MFEVFLMFIVGFWPAWNQKTLSVPKLRFEVFLNCNMVQHNNNNK